MQALGLPGAPEVGVESGEVAGEASAAEQVQVQVQEVWEGGGGGRRRGRRSRR